MSLAEDIDETLSEIDDEDLDDAAEDEDSFAERRRRRRQKVRGRGYATPRHNGNPVNQTQLQAALARVAEDVRKLAAGQAALDSRVTAGLKRVRGEGQQSGQMAALMPLLMKPKAKTIAELAAAGELATAKFMIESGDSMSMLLPLMMMGGMGGTTGGGGDNNMMMMAMVMIAMQK